MATGTTVQITMPEMGESVTEGTILEWLKQVGDPVEADEGVVEVSTDKVDAEVPAPASGVLAKILVQPDETVPTGTVLGEIEVNGAALPSPVAGTLAEILVQPDETVKTGTVVARIAPGASVARVPPGEPARRTERATPEAVRERPAQGNGAANATPVAARMADAAG